MLQANFHRWTIELWHLGSRVGDENVKLAKARLHQLEHLLNFILLCHVGFHHEAIATTFANLRECVVGRGFILHIIDCDVRAGFGQL